MGNHPGVRTKEAVETDTSRVGRDDIRPQLGFRHFEAQDLMSTWKQKIRAGIQHEHRRGCSHHERKLEKSHCQDQGWERMS